MMIDDRELAIDKYTPEAARAAGLSEEQIVAIFDEGKKNLLQRIGDGLHALGNAFDEWLHTDAKSVMPREAKAGSFITTEGHVVFVGGPGGGSGGAGAGALSEHAATAAANRYGIGANEVGFAELSPDQFAAVRDATVPVDKIPFVTPYSADEYREMGAKTYLSETGKSGYALKPDGDIISVFSASGAGEGKWVINSAIMNGGSKLDCFDGFLARDFYPSFGFKEYDRWTWNNDYAPKNWNYDKYDNPDVVLMSLQ